MPIQQLLLANQLGKFEYNFRCRKWFFGRLPRKIKIFEIMAFGHLTEVLRSILKSYVFSKSGRIFLFPMTMAFCLLTYSVKYFIYSAASRSLGSIFLGTTHNDMFTSKCSVCCFYFGKTWDIRRMLLVCCNNSWLNPSRKLTKSHQRKVTWKCCADPSGVLFYYYLLICFSWSGYSFYHTYWKVTLLP